MVISSIRFQPGGGDIFIHAVPLAGDGHPVGVVGWDSSLYAVAACADPSSVDNRIVGSDGALEETIVVNGNDADPIYIVVDGSNGEGGLELRWGPVHAVMMVSVPIMNGAASILAKLLNLKAVYAGSTRSGFIRGAVALLLWAIFSGPNSRLRLHINRSIERLNVHLKPGPLRLQNQCRVPKLLRQN